MASLMENLWSGKRKEKNARGEARRDLFAASSPRVFTMPPTTPFIPALVAGVREWASLSEDPLALADVTILAPNRRSVRAITHAFAGDQSAAKSAKLLPRIIALGDAGEAGDAGPLGAAALASLPAVSRVRRQFELAALLAAKDQALGDDVDPTGRLGLADALGQLLDEAAEFGADLSEVARLYERLPAHLQHAALFLDIVQRAWPARLDELGCVDPGARTASVLRALANTWAERPPAGPVIAAGSTGSQPATAELLAVIARMPQGAVVLPGFSTDLDSEARAVLDDQHPEANMQRLVAAIRCAPEQVTPWPASPPPTTGETDRRLLISEALRPAGVAHQWPDRLAASWPVERIASALEGLTVLVAPDTARHARAIALAARHELEADPGARIMVVIPDHDLATRTALALDRWDIRANVAAGQPLIATPAGAYLALLAALAADPGDPLALAALVKHPLTACGLARPVLRERFALLERHALRGPRAGADLTAVRARLEAARERIAEISPEKAAALEVSLDLLDAIAAGLAPLLEAQQGAIEDWARALGEAAETCADTPDQPGALRVWANADGRCAAELLTAMITDSEAAAPVDIAQFAATLETLARSASVRQPSDRDGPVQILGPLEARLMSADLVIVAGLSEGVWPVAPNEDPFVSRGMREACGLPAPERKIGLAAHDVAQLTCARNVMLTRAEREGGAPAVASRWLWRLQNVVDGAGADWDALTAPAIDYVALAERLDAPARAAGQPITPPAPRPPVSARPRDLSVTRVREWVRDPYALYARKILDLQPLDPLGRPPGARERGMALHAALAELYRDNAPPDTFVDAFPGLAEAALRARGFPAEALAAERPRLIAVARWLAGWETARAGRGWTPAAFEIEGELPIEAEAGTFILRARADRLDAGPFGLAVLDYKTGLPPSRAQVEAGLEPQLSLEAAIAASGGFADLAAAPIAELVYVQLGQSGQAGRVSQIAEAEAAQALAVDALAGLARLVARYDDPMTAYHAVGAPTSSAFPGDYDRLARRDEWAGLAGAD